jgi:hypothetical protein
MGMSSRASREPDAHAYVIREEAETILLIERSLLSLVSMVNTLRLTGEATEILPLHC